MQPAHLTRDASTLADFRSREDGLRGHLDAVRARLARCVELARELPALERRAVAAGAGAYRTDAADVEAKLAAARAARGERARLRVEEADLMTELEALRARLERRGIRQVSLPMLDDVSIASPCDVSWADMEGDADVRFCDKCAKHVFNLSMMSRPEAEAVLATSGGTACIRLYRRTDGTVLTDDCPVGARRRRFWRRTTGIAAAGLLLAALGALAYGQLTCSVHLAGQSAAGGGMH